MTDTPVKSAWKLMGIYSFCYGWLKGLVLLPITTILFLFAQLFRLLALALWRTYVILSLGIKLSPSALPDLSPTDEPEHVDVCMKALESYIKRPKVKSIAITGPYSGGKTSFIQHFFKYRPYRVQYISLATILGNYSEENQDTKNTDNGDPSTADLNESLCIEQSILQQLVQPNHRNLLSRYVWSALLIFFVVVGFHSYDLFTHKTPIIDLLHTMGQDTLHGDSVFWVSVLFLSLLIIFIKDVILIIRSYRLKKLSVAKGEFELVDQSSTSLLNLHLNQIREHFEQNPTDVVVFEDLDRFGRTDIFIKLREINKLVNDARPPLKAPIRFIFAISDDVFKESRDRTKFFDAIVSLVPVANTHKAYALFTRLVAEKLGESLLETLEFTDRRECICKTLKELGKIKSYQSVHDENKHKIVVRL